MVPNLGRKLAIVFLLLGVSALLILVKEPPFRMGLDLQGGTRLAYRFDFEQAKREGTIAPEENPSDVLQQTIDIIYNRVDPDGVLEPLIRTEGTDRIVIELPGRPRLSGTATSTIQTEIDAAAFSLELAPETAAGFPENGGIVKVGTEQIRYDARRGTTLVNLSRGHLETARSPHAAGDSVLLVSDDAIRNAIENLGELQFLILANAADFTGTGTDLPAQQQRLADWADANPGAALASFNRLTEEEGGPHASIRWFPMSVEEAQRALPETDRAQACLVPTEEWTFRGADLGKVFYTQDSFGYNAVGFEMQPARVTEFADFTGDYVGRRMGIVLNGEIRSAPNLEERLPGRGIVRGQFTMPEVRELVTVLRTGSLKIKPILEAEEVVGPALGADYVNLGFTSALLGLAAVIVFVGFYYRRLGGYAALSLAATMLMLMGGLAFLQATLTLPGIAGIILTVGMAVDANILIFDRIREEMDKGRNVKQAAKNGFEHAMSTIVDANLTTLITAIILYRVGTGPVRGFAVTLSIGILASMFSALVITRLLVHFALEKDAKPFSMGTWLVKANWKFLSKAKLVLPVSLALIIGGVGLFVWLPNTQKLGIDFLGGGTVMFRTEAAQDVEDMRTRIGSIQGEIGASSEVKPVLSTRVGEPGAYRYTAFRTTFKVDPERVQASGEDAVDVFASAVSSAVIDVLQKGPVEVSLGGLSQGATAAVVKIYFVDEHPAEAVAAALEAAEFRNVEITSSDRKSIFSANVESTKSDDMLGIQGQIQDAFQGKSDPTGVPYQLANPIPEKNVVGPQVVGELQDKAILALAISLFAIVMYIRVRFAEYSYGFAAVAALLHDVLITLGVISVAMLTGLVEVEINLPLIAAFLTIIGYSLNDTIVLFDRVRENLPRVDRPLEEVLDLSINQTLSRTILTSLTTLLAVAILFAFNLGTGNVLEGFAFAMVIGVLVGTYSSIFVASPVFLWFEKRKGRGGESRKVEAIVQAPRTASQPV